MRLILGYRPSSGVHETILESSTTRQLDALLPSWREYFQTRNLYSSAVSDAADLTDALGLDGWIYDHDVSVIVTLGQDVARRFVYGMGHAPWLSWHELYPRRDDRPIAVLKLPHPSGRNRWYNDPQHLAHASIELVLAAHI